MNTDVTQERIDQLLKTLTECQADGTRLVLANRELESLLSSEKTAHQETREKLSEADELFKSACTEVSRLQDSDEIRRENARLQDALSELNSYDAPAEVVQLRSQLQETSLKLKECQERAVCPHGKTGPCERCISALLNDPEFRGKVISEELTEKERQLSAAITARDMNHEQWKLLKSELAEKERQLVESFDALEHLLVRVGNLLARIHRDGGHYEAEHGTNKSIEDAENVVIEQAKRIEEFGTEIYSLVSHRYKLVDRNAQLEAALGTAIDVIESNIGANTVPHPSQVRRLKQLLSPPVQPEAPAKERE